MSSRRRGLVHLLDAADKPGFLDRTELGLKFTDTVPQDLVLPARALSLIGFHGTKVDDEPITLECIALARKAGKATTFKPRIALEDIVRFEPLSLGVLTELIPTRLQRHVGVGSVPPTTWNAVLAALREVRPGIAEAIDRLGRLLDSDRPMTDVEQIVAFERDAVALALSLTGRRPYVVRDEIADLSLGSPLVQPQATSLDRDRCG